MDLSERFRAFHERLGFGRASEIKDVRIHLDAVIDWLCYAQDVTSDDGVSQTYLVKSHHWANSYPETTGYIIPTFYSYAHLTKRDDIRKRAKQMADWECEIQTNCGGVLAGAIGDSDQPTIFNTGQVLFGWVRAFEEENDERYLQAAIKAANWLCDVQDDDGCWRRFGSPMTNKSINTYNTRSAWGLLRAYQVTDEKRFLNAAIKNIEWAMNQRQNNGWLAQNCLQDDAQPFLHTIAYAMRGIMEVGAFTQRQDFIDQAILMGDALINELPKNGYMPGRFDAKWAPTVKWSCLTGDAQIAINWSRLFQLTGEEKYRDAVKCILHFLKSTQKLDGDKAERGGIKGSYPIDGGYHPWQYPNWASKFYADALMLEMSIDNTESANWTFTNDG
jgi:uncharacterized protein YyaL (SSP411 family)